MDLPMSPLLGAAAILLGKFQMTAASFLKIDPAVTLALQTVGEVLGTSFSPGCVIMGITTTGLDGAEGDILKRIVPVAGGCGVIFGLSAYLILAS